MMPIAAAAVLAVMMFGFGIFVGYAIAAHQDLRRIERDLDEMEQR